MLGKFLKVLGFSLLGLVVLFGGVFLFSPRVNYQNPERLRALGTEPFQAELWSKADAEARGRQLYDFVSRGLFKGKSEAALKALLGEPTARYLHPRNLAYQVGPAGVKSRFGERFTFALVRDPKADAYQAFWIEPFPEEVWKDRRRPAP